MTVEVGLRNKSKKNFWNLGSSGGADVGPFITQAEEPAEKPFAEGNTASEFMVARLLQRPGDYVGLPVEA